MSGAILGMHHVTAIASDPQRNVDFYTGVLGLRLVKLTVNFDDPRSYHLYYGDEVGHPGTIMTFFAWLGVPKGRHGTGQVTATSFSVPQSIVSRCASRAYMTSSPPLPTIVSRLGTTRMMSAPLPPSTGSERRAAARLRVGRRHLHPRRGRPACTGRGGGTSLRGPRIAHGSPTPPHTDSGRSARTVRARLT